jgi:magnesium-transporting ATPase (P-type)
MRVTVNDGDGKRSYLKGAPEVILRRSLLTDGERRLWEEKAEAYAREGFRLLALAHRAGEGEQELEFLGLVLLWDPPRPEVPDAIRRAQEAGIRVMMITGDHPTTALTVAHEVGIADSIVMGLRDKTGAILLPLTAVQLLWVNIVTDGAPALALGLDRDSAVMREHPRDPQSPLLDQATLRFILMAGCTLATVGGVLLLLMPRIGFTLPQTRTAIFLHMTIGQLFYAYPARRNIVSGAHPRFNGALHLAVVLGIGLQLLTVLVPGLRQLLRLEPLTFKLLVPVITSVLLAWGVAEASARLATKTMEAKSAK